MNTQSVRLFDEQMHRAALAQVYSSACVWSATGRTVRNVLGIHPLLVGMMFWYWFCKVMLGRMKAGHVDDS